MYHIAQDLGSPLTFDRVVTLLLEHAPAIAGFITGKNVNMHPVLERLLPRPPWLPPPRQR